MVDDICVRHLDFAGGNFTFTTPQGIPTTTPLLTSPSQSTTVTATATPSLAMQQV